MELWWKIACGYKKTYNLISFLKVEKILTFKILYHVFLIFSKIFLGQFLFYFILYFFNLFLSFNRLLTVDKLEHEVGTSITIA